MKMKKTIITFLLGVLLPGFLIWLPNASAESSKYDGKWKGDSTGVFITIVIEGGTLKSIDTEYLFTNKKKCTRGEAVFSKGFKGSRTFSQQIPDSVRNDMKIEDDSFSWDLSQFFRGELIVNGTFANAKILRGEVVSKCPSYNLSWFAVKKQD
jgi:hypothetical protein